MNETTAETSSVCRSCGSGHLSRVLSLGRTPLADRLLTKQMLDKPEPRHPLTLMFCSECSLVQIAETVSPEVLFCEDYPYYSSFSPALLEHSRANAESLIEARALGPDSLVMELASNDGYMLRNFKDHGIPVLGIDPAEGPARVARDHGIDTMCVFFTQALSEQLRQDGKLADVLIANNVLAHVPDLNGFAAGIGRVVKKTGVAVIEVPYVKDLVDHCEFDTIYHEHLCYFSLTALVHLFARHELIVNHVERLSIHGGSLRVFVGHGPEVSDAARVLMEQEQAAHVGEVGYYRDFADSVANVRVALLKLLRDLKSAGKRIAAYGAAAKGATLINHVGIGLDLVEFVVDRNTHKQGCFMPGQHQPIYPCEHLLSEMPDYVLLLAWNFAAEIAQQQAEYLARGGTFIIPVPTPRLIGKDDVAGLR